MDGVVSKKTSPAPKGSLEELSIRGLGVIDEAVIDFAPGFNVITGETGAGKTMVLTALSLILGGKSDPQLIRHNADRLLASGRFHLSPSTEERISSSIEIAGGEVEESSLILTRQLTKDGKSRASLGGAPSTASQLSEVGSHLIAVHGQHASLSLSKSTKQRELLDAFGGQELALALGEYRALRAEILELRSRISDLRTALQSRDREMEELRQLTRDYEKLKPREGEIDELSALIARLGSVESLREAASSALSALDDESLGAVNSLSSAKRALHASQGKDGELDRLGDQVADSLYALTDIVSSLHRYLESLDADPGALDSAQERKAALMSFAKKYGSGEFDLALARAREAASRMKDLQGGDETLVQLEREHSALFGRVKKSASDLSSQRSKSSEVLSKAITKELAALSMPNGRFTIQITSTEIDEKSDLRESGVDEIEMLFSSHGGNLLPIAKAASGGELSRLLLALEVSLAGRDLLDTYVFDEVDTGIGGKAALEVGKRLRQLAEDAQVIVVTHLPQVAIWADHHLVVEKSESGSVTSSSLRVVDGEERESEIARMLSGLEDSEHAQEHARELLELRKAHFR